MKRIIIKDEIFDLFPDFYRGIVLVKDIQNQKSNKRIRKLLKKEIERQVAIDESSDGRILAWEEAHRKDVHEVHVVHCLSRRATNRQN